MATATLTQLLNYGSVSVTYQLESDHKAVLACLSLSKPLQNWHLVIHRKLKIITKNKFSSDAVQHLSFIPSSSDSASRYTQLSASSQISMHMPPHISCPTICTHLGTRLKSVRQAQTSAGRTLMALHETHCPQTNLSKRKTKSPEWFSPPKPNTITTTPLTLLQPKNSTPAWMNFLALLNPLLCLLLIVQLNCCPCSLLSSLLKFKISMTSLTRHLSSCAFLTYLSPEHRSLAFILSLK